VTNEFPVSGSDGEWDRGLWWMVLASGALHLIVIAVLLLMPQRFIHRPPRLVSYAVDLVAPERVGGTNIVEGGKGRVEGAPLVAAPPAPKVEPPKPPPPPKVEAKPPPKPEPPKAEPQKPPEQLAKPEPKPPQAEEKPQEKPKEDEMALAEKAKQPSPPPTAAKPQPSPQVKPQPSPKAVAKAEPPKVDAKAAAEAKKAAEAKAAADAKAAKEAAAAHERDERIAAAVRRVEQRSGVRGGGLGNKAGAQPGGAVSVGPGEGLGGTIKGVEYLLYYNQLLNRIKQSWAWAGTERSLEAVVRFNIGEDGEILNVRIVQASGDASYDASVERAVRAVNPLAPPPQAYRKEFSDVELTFSPEQMQQ
jgi:colicin import membrane protein